MLALKGAGHCFGNKRLCLLQSWRLSVREMMVSSLPLPSRSVLPAQESYNEADTAAQPWQAKPLFSPQSELGFRKTGLCLAQFLVSAIVPGKAEPKTTRLWDTMGQYWEAFSEWKKKKKEVCRRKVTAISYHPSAFPSPHTPHMITTLGVPDVSKTLTNSRLWTGTALDFSWDCDSRNLPQRPHRLWLGEPG